MGLMDCRGVDTPFGRLDVIEDVLSLNPEKISRLNDNELLILLRWWEQEGPQIYEEHWNKTRNPEPPLDGFGYIYFVRRSDGATKIGYTRNPEERLQRLNELEGEKLAIVRIVEVDQPVIVEQNAHEYFAEYRVRGEWFRLEDDQINAWRYKENER